MKTKKRIFLETVIITLIFFGANTVICDEQQEAVDQEALKKSAAEMEQYVADAKKQLEESTKCFAEEGQEFADYNKILLDQKQKEIDLMQKMVDAIKNNDKAQLENLEREKDDLAYQTTLTSLKKEMAQTVSELQKRAKDYPGDERIQSGISLVQSRFSEVIKAEMDAYRANRDLKYAYKAKENACKMCDVYFLDAEKQKKIDEIAK